MHRVRPGRPVRGHPDPAVPGRAALPGAHPGRAGRAARARRGPVLPARPVLVRALPGPAAPGQEQEKAPSGLTLEAAALGYMRRGWPVFVLGRSKRPVANCPACKTAGPGHDPAGCACLTCHGFHAATTSPARLAAMLAAVPGGLLAIRTGTAAGLAVVDIDPRNGGQVDPALMTPTATVATGGGGWHLYYRHPGGPLLPALPGRAGVDVKADGGYVVAPPSVHPGTGRPYRWAGERPVAEMPPALRAALAPPPAAARPAPLSGPPPTRRGGGHLITPGAARRAPAGRAERPRRPPPGHLVRRGPRHRPHGHRRGHHRSRRPRRAHRGRAGRRSRPNATSAPPSTARSATKEPPHDDRPGRHRCTTAWPAARRCPAGRARATGRLRHLTLWHGEHGRRAGPAARGEAVPGGRARAPGTAAPT